MVGPRHLVAFALGLGAATVLALGAGCGGDDDPVSLRLGAYDAAGTPGGRQAQEFARRVADLSGGRIRVEPVLDIRGGAPDWEAHVAKQVRSGRLDLALVATRAWDTQGVTTLRALNAPFLVTSDALVEQVVTGPVAGELLGGLDRAGVAGLALVPEGLRHPFGLRGRPVLGPDDYAGRKIRTPTSRTTAALFAALGATADPGDPDARVHAAVDSSFQLDPGGVAAGDVTFFPKVNALVADRDALDRLTDEQRRVLRTAAEQTRGWALDSTVPDGQAAAAWCERGGRMALAGDERLAALERAARPVTASLERDPATRRIIERIRAMKQRVRIAAPAPAACGRRAQAGSRAALDGVYRFELTDRQLRAAGVGDDELAENHGVFTVTLSDGQYCWEQKAPNPIENPSQCSEYELDGTRMTWRYPVGEPDVFRVRRRGGDLRLTAISGGELAFARAWAANTWRRVGDP